MTQLEPLAFAGGSTRRGLGDRAILAARIEIRRGRMKKAMSKRGAAVKARLEAMPGAVAEGGPVTGVSLYKVKGKVFAILELRDDRESVILKCDPELVEPLREKHAGIGHRGHLDRRFWICVSLDADVPAKVIARLVELSYDLVRAKLTRKQKAELDAM